MLFCGLDGATTTIHHKLKNCLIHDELSSYLTKPIYEKLTLINYTIKIVEPDTLFNDNRCLVIFVII